ncbi:hypothetical protein WJ968_22835 [Achromobacter xylosoxidans]
MTIPKAYIDQNGLREGSQVELHMSVGGSLSNRQRVRAMRSPTSWLKCRMGCPEPTAGTTCPLSDGSATDGIRAQPRRYRASTV